MNSTLAHYLIAGAFGITTAAILALLLFLWDRRHPILPQLPKDVMPKLLFRIWISAAVTSGALFWLAK